MAESLKAFFDRLAEGPAALLASLGAFMIDSQGRQIARWAPVKYSPAG